jgi:ComF family protein
LVHKALGKREEIWLGLDAIIPVPLHPKREKRRGFNQAQVIAKELANLQKVKLLEGVLVKTKNVPPQTFLQLKEREKNVRGAFRVVKKEKIKDRVVLLVDDVYTTGSTVRECSLVLKEAGAKEVKALTIAQA